MAKPSYFEREKCAYLKIRFVSSVSFRIVVFIASGFDILRIRNQGFDMRCGVST
jgi:hypothetical protein